MREPTGSHFFGHTPRETLLRCLSVGPLRVNTLLLLFEFQPSEVDHDEVEDREQDHGKRVGLGEPVELVS